MQVQIVKTRQRGVPLDRHFIRDRAPKSEGLLVIMDVTDQGLRRPVKVARLERAEFPDLRMELLEPHIIWASDGRFTLAGYERVKNEEGQLVDFAQSWLCTLIEGAPMLEVTRRSTPVS